MPFFGCVVFDMRSMQSVTTHQRTLSAAKAISRKVVCNATATSRRVKLEAPGTSTGVEFAPLINVTEQK
jgi:hypothetical protein